MIVHLARQMFEHQCRRDGIDAETAERAWNDAAVATFWLAEAMYVIGVLVEWDDAEE